MWRQAVDEETDEQRLDRLEAEEAEANGEDVAEQNRMEELEAKTLEAKREMDVADALDEIRTRNARIARADHRDHLEAMALARPGDEEERLRQQDLEDEEAARAAFAAAAADAGGGGGHDNNDDDNNDDDDKDDKDDDDDDDDDGGQPAWLQSSKTAVSRPKAGSNSNGGSKGGGSKSGSSTSTPQPVSLPVAAEETIAPVPSFKRQVKKKKDHASLLGIKKKPSLV